MGHFGNHDITSAVILYGRPAKTAAQENLIRATNSINLNEIDRQREEIKIEISQKMAYQQKIYGSAVVDNIKDVIIVKERGQTPFFMPVCIYKNSL